MGAPHKTRSIYKYIKDSCSRFHTYSVEIGLESASDLKDHETMVATSREAVMFQGLSRLRDIVVYMGVPLPLIVIGIPVWTALWALLGYWVGRMHQRPKQYLVFREPGDDRPDDQLEEKIPL
jgi:hypothetical protein